MIMKKIKRLFAGVTRKQSGEFGLTAILVTLFLALYFKKEVYVVLAFVFTLVTLIMPVVFYPFAVIWSGLSKLLGMLSSAVMLTLVFFLVLMPVGVLRKLMGKDRMRQKQFKKTRQSVLVTRDHLFTEEDFLNSF
jgi:hypothetical protein